MTKSLRQQTKSFAALTMLTDNILKTTELYEYFMLYNQVVVQT